MGNNKKFYYKKKNKQVSNIQDNEPLNYSEEQLSLTLEDLKLSDSTITLLKNSKIEKSYDLVRRTEKDMYKVQGLNKKILFEIKDALKAVDLALKIDPTVLPKENKDNKNKQDVKPKQENSQIQVKDEKKSKFGLSEKVVEKDNVSKTNTTKPVQEAIQDSFRKVMKGGKWGYIDGSKVIIPTMYDEIFAFKEDLAVVELNEKCGYIDKKNNVIIPIDYDMALSFSEGLALVSKGEKCGYINKNNEVIIPFEYEAGTPFEDGEAKVKKDGKWATLTKDGKFTWI